MANIETEHPKYKPTVYLAGPWDRFAGYWKRDLMNEIKGYDFYDPEIDSPQESPDKYFPADLAAIRNADMMIFNPGIAPAEAGWFEVGYFYATHTEYGRTPKIIVVWPDEREPKWALDFIDQASNVVKDMDGVKKILA